MRRGAGQPEGAAIFNRLLCFCSILLFSGNCEAQEAVTPGLRWRAVTGYAEVVVANKYIYNGFIEEDRGPVVQPYFELYEKFYEGNGALTSGSAKFSFFTSLQSRRDAPAHTNAPGDWFYETQIEAGVELLLAKQFTFGISYFRFESPIDAYQASNALQLSLSWDDKDIAGWFPLHPHITWLAAIPFAWNDEAGDGNYLEIGISPATVLAKETQYPITVTLPVTAGFGDKIYYGGDHFGFASVGLSGATPLAFLPKSVGEWKAMLGATWYYLGRGAANLSPNADRHQTVFAATLSTEF